MQLTKVATPKTAIRQSRPSRIRSEGPDIAAEQACSEAAATACDYCHGSIAPSRQRRHARWCSQRCGEAFRYGAKESAATSPSTKNAIARLLVCADLLLRGLKFFVAPAPSDQGDLAIFKNDKCLRVRIKSGRRRASEKKGLAYAAKANGTWDALAIVITNEDNAIEYIPPVESW